MRFFLIDDDEIFHFITEKTLHRINTNIKMESFKDGEEAINGLKKKLKTNSKLPDIVLLDINMPFMNGWTFMEEYKKIEDQIYQKIEIYMLTSSDDPEDLERANKISELSGYMVKPISEEELETLIREFPMED